MTYTIEDLFQSVNDIYAQYDDGVVPLDDANAILENCCRAFLENLEGNSNENL
jgi:hypothetical protein